MYSFKKQNKRENEKILSIEVRNTRTDEFTDNRLDKPIKPIQETEERKRQKEYAKEIVDTLYKESSIKEINILDLLKEGLGRKDISGILKISNGEVRQIMFRIRNKTERIIRRLNWYNIYV